MKKEFSLIISCYKLLEKRGALILGWILRLFLAGIAFVSSYYYSQLLQLLIRHEDQEINLVVLAIGLFFLHIIIETIVFCLEIYFEKDNRVRIKRIILERLLLMAPDAEGIEDSSRNTAIIYADVNSTTSLLLSGWMILMNLCSAFCAAYLIARMNVRFLIPIISLVLVEAVIIIISKERAKTLSEDIRRDTDENYKFVRDVLINIRSIQINGAGMFFINKFSLSAERIKAKIINRESLGLAVNNLIKIINFIAIVVGLFFSVTSDKTDAQNPIFMVLCARIMLSSASQLIIMLISLQPMFIAVERVISLFNLEDKRGKKENSSIPRSIELKRVSFSYGDVCVIKDITCSFDENGIYVVRGENGSGKTTLLNLIAGAYLPSSGVVLWDGEDTGQFNYISLAKKVAYLSQFDVVFDLSFSENMLFEAPELMDGKGKWQERINYVCTAINLDYNRWGRLQASAPLCCKASFGQQRKMCIVRTLMRDKSVIILDEPLTGLDLESRKGLCKLLEEMSAQRIIIVATHEDLDVSNIRRTIHL